MFIVVLVVIIAGVAIVGGGHTFHGFGHDVKQSGEKLERATD